VGLVTEDIRKEGDPYLATYLATFKGIKPLEMNVLVGADHMLGNWCSHVKFFTASPDQAKQIQRHVIEWV
jgi:hypothetical protein